jgi:hypothetical protein
MSHTGGYWFHSRFQEVFRNTGVEEAIFPDLIFGIPASSRVSVKSPSQIGLFLKTLFN